MMRYKTNDDTTHHLGRKCVKTQLNLCFYFFKDHLFESQRKSEIFHPLVHSQLVTVAGQG